MKVSLARALLAVSLTAALLPGCTGLLADREELLQALQNTEPLAREFTYRETAQGHTVTVKGSFEDDLRYSALLARDGLGVFQMVVQDDTLAVKVFDASKIPALQSPPEDPAMKASIDGLNKGEWVIDPAGAPALESVAAGQGIVSVGQDPVLDALNVLLYVRNSIREAATVKEWQKEDVEPAYKAREDVFDPSNQSLGVKRFDLVRVALPKSQGPGVNPEPRTFNFRKMAIYVKNARIIRISEAIDYETHFEIRRAKDEGRPKFLLDMLSRLRLGQTEEKIRPRTMTLEIQTKSTNVEVPIGLTSSLEGLFGATPAEAPTQPSQDQQQPSDTTSPSP